MRLDFLVAVTLTFGILHPVGSLDVPTIVPAVNSWKAGEGIYTLPQTLQVVVDSTFQNAKDETGLTLIPPTLHTFAETFVLDLSLTFLDTQVNLSVSNSPLTDGSFLTIDQTTNYTLAKGTPTSEGYSLGITTSGVTISGASPLGVWRGVTTLFQGLVQGNGSYPAGQVVDRPDWSTRGIMLDCGRQWYPINYLKEMCTYFSYFKVSEFHLHLSDNLPGTVTGPIDSVYARFRLHSENPAFAGLTPHVNETYSQEEFDDLQNTCAGRGVTIVPEIEAPGHALVITQWKPELALSTDPTLLNLSIPESTQTMMDIWTEFIPWLHSKQVSIGADEYDSALADDYIRFVGNMSDFIQAKSNKTIRSWGTFEPSLTGLELTRQTIIQHWEGFEDNAFQLIQEGYRVINSDDFFQYIVLKESGSYPQKINQTSVWHGNEHGGPWDPTQFNRTLVPQQTNPNITSSNLEGGIMAVWSDQGPTATTPLEAFYAFKMGIPVIAAAGWYAANRPSALTQAQFDAIYHILEASAPGQNLDRRVKSKSDVVVEYDFSKGTSATSVVNDLSGNGYNANLGAGAERGSGFVTLSNGTTITTPLGSKGMNYTLLLNFTTSIPVASPATLLSGPDDTFILVPFLNGSISGTTFAFLSSNITYPLFHYTLPKGSGRTEVVLQGTEESTSCWVNGTMVGDFVVVIRDSTLQRGMAFVAPIGTIGGDGFAGDVSAFKVWDGLQNIADVTL